MSLASNLSAHLSGTPEVRRVPLAQPLTWIQKGWDDLLRHKGASLAYGALVSILGALILTIGRHPFIIAAAISGFLLVGPVIATGLCELSRLKTKGKVANFDSSLEPLASHRKSLVHYTGTLLAFSVVWFVVSSLMLYLAFGSVGPTYYEAIFDGVLANVSAGQIFAYLVFGGILAGFVFALSVVTVPMILDRNVDAGTAMRTSLRATLEADLPVMIVWAALCVILVAVGFLTFLVGMVVIFPLLGHATWYAYLDLVPQSKTPT
jgi:uncharacterized membrane protein